MYFSFPSFHFLPPPPPPPRLSTINARDAEKTRDAFVHLMALVVALLKDTYVTSPHAELFQRTFLYCWKNRGRRGGYRRKRELERNFLAESLWHFKKSKLNFHIWNFLSPRILIEREIDIRRFFRKVINSIEECIEINSIELNWTTNKYSIINKIYYYLDLSFV